MTSRPDPLVERWRTDAGQALVVEVFRRLQAGRTLEGLPIGRHEGRADLRGVSRPCGLPADAGWRPALTDSDEEPALRRASPPELGTVVIESLDFSGAELPSWRWMGTTVRNCRFDGADCHGLNTWDTLVEDVSFRSTDLRAPGIGSPGCVFRHVDFSRANLRGAYGAHGEFVDCDFSNAKFPGLEWFVTLVRCRFAGTLRNMRFYDHWPSETGPQHFVLEDVDFSAAQLQWIEFRGFDLARVRLPEDSNHLLIRGDVRRVYELACELIDESPSRELGGLQDVLKDMLRRLHPDCRVALFNLKDLAEFDGGTGKRVALLRRAAAAVGATTNL